MLVRMKNVYVTQFKQQANDKLVVTILKYFPESNKNFALHHYSSCSHALRREICCLIHTTIKMLSTENKSDILSRCATVNVTVSPYLINCTKQNTTCTFYLIKDQNDDKP